MNIRLIYHALLVCITTFALSIQAETKNRHGVRMETPGQQDQEKLLKFYTPIKPTSAGITNFLKYMYNDPEYAQDFLPNDFSHLYQLLAKKQTRAYAQSVLRLFSNKLKGSPYVNAHAFAYVVERLPQLLNPYFVVARDAEFEDVRAKINNLLYARFLNKFDAFKQNPNAFFEDLSQEIVDSLNNVNLEVADISMEELRKTALVFLEVGLGKLIWCPTDGLDTWKSVKTISDHLLKLSENNCLVDPDDMNDLNITLLERYCYFIDLAATNLPNNFFASIQQDMIKNPCKLFQLEEQESMIEPKLNRFKKALTLGQARKHAFQQGILTS